MGTTVEYNGIKLTGVITRGYDAEIQYDAGSQTDLIGEKIRFTWEGYVHVQNVTSAPVATLFGPNNNSAPSTWAPSLADHLQKMLSTPRQALRVSVTDTATGLDTVFFECNPAIGSFVGKVNTDVNNGPRPLAVNVTKIVADKLFRVSFAIEVMKSFCANGDGQAITPANIVINNRWAVSESLDMNYFTTRTIRGRIRFSNSINSPHVYKAICVPSLEPGFARISLDFDALENGLEATYTVVDRQVHTAAPWPCTKFNATHEEATEEALSFTSTMTVNCEGDPSTNKVELFMRAAQICDARLNFLTEKGDSKFFIEYAAMTDYIGERNQVAMIVRLRRYDPNVSGFIANLFSKQMGKPLELAPLANAEGNSGEYNANYSRVPDPWGYNADGERDPRAVVKFFSHCYLQSPCMGNKVVWRGDSYPPKQASKEKAPEDKTTISGATVSELPSSDGTLVNSDHTRAIYISAKMSSRYVFDGRTAFLGLAWPADPSVTAIPVQLGAGKARRIITFDAERVGDWPLVPAPLNTYADGEIAAALIDWWVEPMPTNLSPDTTKRLFRVAAHYVYGLSRIPNDNETLRTGVLPFTALTQADNKFSPNSYSTAVGP